MLVEGSFKTPYFTELDALRGIAILLVVLYHNFGYISIFKFGWIGVDLFFVLSGFLITNILVANKHTNSGLRNFFLRRILRIFPLYYFAFVFFAFILPFLFKVPYDVMFYKSNQFWFWTFLQNWFFIFKHPEKYQLLNHFWTIAVEEQFYIVWPFVVFFLISQDNLIKFLITLFFLLLSLRIVLWITQPFHILFDTLFTFSRIDGLIIGSIASLRYHQPKPHFRIEKLIVGLFILNVLLVLSLKLINSNTYYLNLILYPGIAILFGMIVITSIKKNECVYLNLLLHSSSLTFFGKISYSLYVFHWPIFLLLSFLNKNHRFIDSDRIIGKIVVSLIASGLAVLVSYITYNLIEKKFLILKSSFPYSL